MGGVLIVSNPGALSLGAFTLNANGGITLTGATISGTGTLALAGDVTTNASGTTASIGTPTALGGSTRTFTVANGGANPDLTVSSVISSGAGVGLIKNGPGTMSLAGGGAGAYWSGV